MGRIVSAKSADEALGTPRTLYFDKRGERGLLRVDRETFKVKFEPGGEVNADMEWSEAHRERLIVPLEEGVWFDFGRILTQTGIATMGTHFSLRRTHTGKKSAEYAQARMLWNGEAVWLTVSIQRPELRRSNQHLTFDMAHRPHVKFWLEIMGRRGHRSLEVNRGGPKATWEGVAYPAGDSLPLVWAGTFHTTPHDLLPYAMGWAEEILFPVSSERLVIALRNGKPVSGYTSLAGVGGARVKYEQLGRKLNLPVTVAAAPPKLASGLSMTAKQLAGWKKAQVDRARLRSRQSRSLRQGMRAERRALEREWGSAIRGGGIDKGSVAAAKRKAKENPSSWYLGGQKQGLRGMQYYYFNRHRPYILHLSVREPKASGKLNKIHVWVNRAHPGPSQETRIRLGELTEKEWWESLDPQRPTRWRGGSLTLDPIEGKRFYFKGHLTSLKYQALDWADSVIFTSAERLALL